MKLETYNTKLIFTAIFLFSIFLFSMPVSAAGLVPCGGPTEEMCTVCDFLVLIQNIINFLLYVFASLATLMAVYIAFLFMFSGGSPAKITDAKGKLWLVIIGIFWVLGSWLVLNTIINFITVIGKPGPFPLPWNQINCEVSRPSLPLSPPGAEVQLYESGASQSGGWGERLGEQEARDRLGDAGIAVNKDSCPIGANYHDIPGGCTSLGGVKASTIEGAIQLKNGCKCTLEVSGGTELGHAEDATTSHASGDKLDFIANPTLDQYIQNNFKYIGLRSDGAKLYRAPDGNLYAREFDHWDVTFAP